MGKRMGYSVCITIFLLLFFIPGGNSVSVLTVYLKSIFIESKYEENEWVSIFSGFLRDSYSTIFALKVF